MLLLPENRYLEILLFGFQRLLAANELLAFGGLMRLKRCGQISSMPRRLSRRRSGSQSAARS